MRRTILALFAAVSGLLGLLSIPTLFYNLAGLFNSPDGADGPKWETMLVVLACLGLIFGAIFLAYRLFRSAAASAASNSR
jgi:hypothetical protein